MNVLILIFGGVYMATTKAQDFVYLKGFNPVELAFLQTREELMEMARALEIPKRSSMKKEELATAIMGFINGLQ